MKGHKSDLVGLFAHHKVAANLLMTMMILAGLLALDRLNVQFFPSFDLDIVTVRVIWSGSSAEDVEDGITNPLEQRLRTVENLYKLTSTSTQGISSITLEFKEDTDPLLALDEVRRLVDEFRNFPKDAEKPEVALATRYESVARVLITGLMDPAEMRRLARRFESELLDRGIDKVSISGLPEEEISIQVDNDRLRELELSLDAIGERVGAFSRDLPAGSIGRGEGARELRSLDKRRDALEFGQVPVKTADEMRIDLGDIAEIRRGPRDGGVWLSRDAAPAVELRLQRAEQGNSLVAARILQKWVEETLPRLPPGVELTVFDESWQLIKERIMLLVKNGAGGLALVVAILYLFLTGRVAFWVAWGIPVSFMATLFILYLAGGSINMISLFALIMALGIIVDDAIVVGEDALAHYQMGEPPLLAAEGGARRMLAPVVASSLDHHRRIPAADADRRDHRQHPVRHSAGDRERDPGLPGREFFGAAGTSAPFLHPCPQGGSALPARTPRRGLLLLSRQAVPAPCRFGDQQQVRHHQPGPIAASDRLSVCWPAGGSTSSSFRPRRRRSSAPMPPSWPVRRRARVDAFLKHLRETLSETEEALEKGKLVNLAIAIHGAKAGGGHGSVRGASGEQLGALEVELVPPDERRVRNDGSGSRLARAHPNARRDWRVSPSPRAARVRRAGISRCA